MDSKAVFRGIAVAKIQDGALSRADRVHVWNHRDTAHACQLYDRPMTPHEMKGEARRDAALLYHVYVAARAAWDSERQRDLRRNV